VKMKSETKRIRICGLKIREIRDSNARKDDGQASE